MQPGRGGQEAGRQLGDCRQVVAAHFLGTVGRIGSDGSCVRARHAATKPSDVPPTAMASTRMRGLALRGGDGARSSGSPQLLRQLRCTVDLVQHMQDGFGVNGHRAGLRIGVDEAAAQGLEVAVEDHAHPFAAGIDQR